MEYLVALVKVCFTLLRYNSIVFHLFLAGRDGIKGGRGDNGRPGNKIIDNMTNFIHISFI